MINNYYWQHKEKHRKKELERYQHLFEEEKEKKCQYYGESNKNLSEEQKKKLVKYMRSYYLAHEK